ncbi:MAG TPA: FprA family A-type flavoprotein [Bacteroides sp.]|nr:FprA family A-type flavoprotein [Bacteroides sp.]
MITLKGNVHYVGVNDRAKTLFEGLWPLPYGVTYNSYLIADEKVALIDTVDVNFFDLFIEKVREVIGKRPIDYLVINHMEPDHSGSIRLLRQFYPNITLVSNKKALDMVEGFYGAGAQTRAINEGDTLELGHHKLRFHMIPMVHWPETMVSYDLTDHILFSGDAFGSFGALNGTPVDTHMDTTLYWSEMERYYANIVGKYGAPVQKALQKLDGVFIEMICSTHGPVWTGENVAKVVGVYDRLSRYATEEGVVIAYGSMYGNTQQMAEAIAEELSVQGIRKIVLHDVSRVNHSYILADLFRYKGIILGAPTYNASIYPQMEMLMSEIEMRDMKDHYLGYFGSFSWASHAVKRLAAFSEKVKFEVVGTPVEMKQGMKDSVRTACQELAKAMADRLKADR